MDPEVSLLLLCPLGGLSQEQVAVELSPAHDRRPLPGGDKTITAIWESRLQTQPWIFDAPKFRLHSAKLASSSPGPQLLLQLGLTSYRDFLGTNWSSSASWLRQQGATDWGDKQAYLADPLGWVPHWSQLMTFLSSCAALSRWPRHLVWWTCLVGTLNLR